MTPIILIFGQSNAAFLDNSQALEGAIEAQGGTVLEVGVHGGSQSAALPGGHWNIIDDDGDATGGSSYTRLLETMERVLADNPDSYIAGAVWVQGEQDSQRHLIGEYYEPVATLFTQMREDLGEDFPISMVGPSDFQSTDPVSRAHIRETQQQLAQDLPDTYFVDTDAIIAENNLTKDEVMRDDLHYTDDFFDHIAQAVLQEPALRQALQLQQQGAALGQAQPSTEHAQADMLLFQLIPTVAYDTAATTDEDDDAQDPPEVWDIF